MEVLISYFGVKERGSTVGREVLGGMTTFATMSYIIFVQPTVLSICGMDFGAVMMATCLSSALATIAMGLYARYPIALAPGMGQNFYLALTVCGTTAAGGLGYSWETALAAVFVAGALFLFLSFFGFRERVITAIPDSLKSGIAAGIGLLIAFVGLQWSGLVVASPGTLVTLGNLKDGCVLLAMCGLVFTVTLMALRVRAAVLIGLLAVFVLGLLTKVLTYHGIVSAPPSLAPTFGKLSFTKLVSGAEIVTAVFVFFFLDLFDTVGTLVGVGRQGGFMKDGRLPRARQAFACDAMGTVAGAVLGTSTVTSYVESAAGITAGARTGLASVVTGLLFVLAIFFAPVARSIGEGVTVAGGAVVYPVVAPALIVVGCLMARNAKDVRWDDASEAIPSFLTMIMMPLAFSITDGIAFGAISFCLIKLLTGRGKQVNWLMYACAVALLARYILLK